ncbi:predicted protein [Uncinocarpus reesii 1704]|uniref:SET domain-containing protein n=1 Tax=Uncinocarpus reesii (strain UAMH 1704) TaxID=336963 RepID=C4JRI7_UNCRE|nr:uncharacterized protein UREG_05076 [Uncinocarpus reesii 1704]EEP80234.1 predicted protein [Uncinocarpus reesii 1704]
MAKPPEPTALQEGDANSSGSEGSLTPTPATAYTPNPKRLPLFDWIKALGGGLPDQIELSTDPIKGQCLRVRDALPESLASGTCCAICPIQATMSIMNLDNAIRGVPSHGFDYSPDFFAAVEEPGALAFFLMDQYLLGDESFWAPYIQSLPDDSQFTRLEYYTGDDLKWLEGTNLLKLREKLLERLKAKYETGLRLLKEFPNKNTPKYTWERFLWASSIILSRAFSSEVLKDYIKGTPTRVKPLEDFSVLVPLVDISNHQPLAQVEWATSLEKIGLIVHKTLLPGEEVPNNYGPRSNERLMMNYGFCIRGNVCDYREMNLRAPPDSPLAIAKQEQQTRFGASKSKLINDRYYIYNIFYPLPAHVQFLEAAIFSPQLLDAAAVLSANDRELTGLQIKEDKIYIPFDKYGNSRSILAGLGQIVLRLLNDIRVLKSNPCYQKEPSNAKQRNASFYRESQIYISECAIAVAEWTLQRARNPRACLDEIVNHLPEEYSKNVHDRIRELITTRLSFVNHDGVLFYGDGVAQILPQAADEAFAICVRNIVKATCHQQSESLDLMKIKLVYTLFLCFCTAAYRNLDNDDPSILTPRLKRWVPLLLGHYTEPPVDVSWMLEEEEVEGLLDRVEELFTTTRRMKDGIFAPLQQLIRKWKSDDQANWLSGNRLRWAWLISDEESVRLAKNPLPFMEPGSTAKEVAVDTYLYIPRYSGE